MKKIAKFSAILLGVCFGACFMLAGCNGNEHTEHVDEDGDGYCDICEEEMPSTEMALTDGIFDGSIETNPGYIRFHEEGELVEGKGTLQSAIDELKKMLSKKDRLTKELLETSRMLSGQLGYH